MRAKVTIDPLFLPPLLFSLLSLVLYFARVIFSGSTQLSFMSWNLGLAWLPVLWAILFMNCIKFYGWSAWSTVLSGILWLIFLPNSFYMVTDFIHLQNGTGSTILFDAVMLLAFAISGLLLGCLSLFIVQRELSKKVSKKALLYLLLALFLSIGYAVYLGRYKGYNSWDIMFNPFGLIMDFFDGIFNPTDSLRMYATVLLFFTFNSVAYFSFYSVVKRLNIKS